ncbi:MAG: ABC transporter substrate-binding protein [Helicobacteraceae bacterium]|jgi:NitT/TauT family transport system substrate-binding protein|nr:ABC transporter substrate-binding protein [Helicobacteraceae bacterium]
MRALVVAAAFLAFALNLSAEKSSLVISKQYGLAYLPLIIAEEQKLIEKHAKAAGLGDIKIEWATFGGGSTANDALLSGTADLVSGGVAPFVRLWDKTNGKVKALASLNDAPIVLVTSNPKVKSLKDLTDKDRIALPSVKVSVQALALQIAVAKEFGVENYDKFDHLTVTLSHPDAFVALSSGKSEITGHIGLEPYSSLELQNPKLHKVFSSYDYFGGAHTTNLVWTSEAFYNDNPKLARSIVAALDEADAFIKQNPKAATKVYLASYSSKEPPELIEAILKKELGYQTKPLPNITAFSDFLYETGAIKRKAKDWQELFFDAVR